MFQILVIKELKNIIQSPKFFTTFLTCSILILLSFYTGITEYKTSVDKYNSAVSLTNKEIESSRSYAGIHQKIYRNPNPLQIISSGVNNDLGRFASVAKSSNVSLKSSYYNEELIFAVFRYLDFTFIVSTVLSLFAILFTYNSINGEKEGGTLKLIFSNSLPRSIFIMAKFLGTWLALVVPVIIPILIGILMILLFNIPLTNDQWFLFIANIFMVFIYFTFFTGLGILVSSITKKSSISFLVLLVSWIVIVFILPRVGTMLAGQIKHVPSIAETKSIQASFEKDKWKEYFDDLQKTWASRNNEMAGMTEKEKEIYSDEKNWEWMQEEDEKRTKIQNEIAEYSNKVIKEMNYKKVEMEKLALFLSRFSPASSYQLACMKLSGTDIEMKSRYQESLENYKKDFITYVDKKQEESGGMGGVRISISPETGLSIDDGRSSNKLDVSDMPVYKGAITPLAQLFNSTIIDVGLLILYTLICFGFTFMRFIKFDLR